MGPGLSAQAELEDVLTPEASREKGASSRDYQDETARFSKCLGVGYFFVPTTKRKTRAVCVLAKKGAYCQNLRSISVMGEIEGACNATMWNKLRSS